MCRSLCRATHTASTTSTAFPISPAFTTSRTPLVDLISKWKRSTAEPPQIQAEMLAGRLRPPAPSWLTLSQNENEVSLNPLRHRQNSSRRDSAPPHPSDWFNLKIWRIWQISANPPIKFLHEKTNTRNISIIDSSSFQCSRIPYEGFCLLFLTRTTEVSQCWYYNLFAIVLPPWSLHSRPRQVKHTRKINIILTNIL